MTDSSRGDNRADCRSEAPSPAPAPLTRTRSAPTRAELEAARDRVISDVTAPGLRVLFCGINPGLWSAARDQHFARPGNRFWPALHRSGFVPEPLGPDRQAELLRHGLGITNVVARATARADELTPGEFVSGGHLLEAKVRQLAPAWLAMVGIGAYRSAFGRPKAVMGRQDHRIGDTSVWVLPNPSGLNAHFNAATLADAFAQLRRACEAAD
jgi:TDG/mug DNA glycosylase family protein